MSDETRRLNASIDGDIAKIEAETEETLERTSRSCDVTTPRTNLRSQSVTMANILRLRNSSSSARGVEGVMIV